MKIDKLRPIPLKKVDFQYLSLKMLPQKKGCYVLTSFDSQIIYLGLSINLKSRLLTHFESSKQEAITELGRIFFAYYIEFENDVELNQTERGWLHQYELEYGKLPPLNKVRSPLL